MYDMVRINQAIKNIVIGVLNSEKPVDLFVGTVIQSSPIKVQISNTLILSKTQLLATDYVVEKNKLKSGEKVLMLRVERGQRFLILDTVGDL